MDGYDFLLQKMELQKGGNTKDLEKWCSHIFYTVAKVGAGTKRWWMDAVHAGKPDTWIL